MFKHRRPPTHRNNKLIIVVLSTLFSLFLFLPHSFADKLAKEMVDNNTKRLPTVLDLQPNRTLQSIHTELQDGKTIEMSLTNLNPRANQWYILSIRRNRPYLSDEYHLENPFPIIQDLVLDDKTSEKLILARNGRRLDCLPWNFFENSELEKARSSRQVYAPLCNGSLYLRNPTRGHRTSIETVTEFFRDNLPGGERFIGFVKNTFLKDAYREKTRTIKSSTVKKFIPPPSSPAQAMLNADSSAQLIRPAHLGIEVKNEQKGMLAGHWYEVDKNPGIFVSVIQPKAIHGDILKSHGRIARRLDPIESKALVYLIAFNLERFSLGFSVGTDHPRVGWSKRTLEKMRVANLPGSDGIDTISPLVRNGMLHPVKAERTVATFTGGFKLSHSAFKYGILANSNRGSHYGFIENGTILSTLKPGLATVFVEKNGEIKMKTWSEKDQQQSAQIVYARQNGVPLVEWNSTSQKPVPGQLVGLWGKGNWSGSVNKKLRTLRAGLALQQHQGKQFLIYAYFSTATPSAMARVFQAYQCRYAMHLDANALEHTYLALYHKNSRHLAVQHLIKGMEVLDKTKKGTYIPRFLGYADNRDFFYLMRRERSQLKQLKPIPPPP